ncbi:MAG TPA: family 43 glycosylhydrolase [Terracidiphilus sp.]
MPTIRLRGVFCQQTILLRAACLSLMLSVAADAVAGPAGTLTVTIDNQSPRRDISGRILDAHDGTLDYFKGRFYLYGTHYGRTNGLGKTNYFVCYSSADLTRWKYEGKLLWNPPARTYYRPHVKFNAQSKEYVLWYNADDEYGVAVSRRPQGPFRIVNPDARLKYSSGGVGDFGLFVDGDGTAYIAYVSFVTSPLESRPVANPKHHRISVERLAPDYLSSTYRNGGFVAGNVESPALFSRAGVYYLLFDNTCAFCKTGSGARVYMSNAPLGPYTYQGNINIRSDSGAEGRSWTRPGTGRDDTILPAQQADVAEFPTTTGTLYMWMGDRWGSTPDGIKGHDFQVWVPLRFRNRKLLPLENEIRWKIHLKN